MARSIRTLAVFTSVALALWLGSVLFTAGTAQAQGHVQDVNQVIEMASR